MKNITKYEQLIKIQNFGHKFKNNFKNILINHLLPKKFNKKNEFIIYPYWHHVFEDEIKNFKLQINFMKNYGDFISYEDSVKVLKEGLNKNERYFCLSFDDGFKNVFQNVIDFFLKDKIPCMFFIPTSFIDNLRGDSGQVFFNKNDIQIEFMSWNDCKKLISEKIFDIGSHSINHNLISKLSYKDALNEIENSKKIIEKKLNRRCNHFAPPVGNYSIPRDLEIIKKTNYKTLSTTLRGKMDNLNHDVFEIKRQHVIANWNYNFLKYFFSK